MHFARCASLLLVLLATPTPALSQSFAGTRVGVSVSTIVGDIPEGAELRSRIGFAGGLVFEIPLRSGFAVQPELLYMAKGYENLSPTGGAEAVRFELTTLDVASFLRYDIELTRSLLIAPHLGPFVEFELSERTSERVGEDEQSDASDRFAGFGFGVAAGVDGTMLIGTTPLSVGARYHRGLTNKLEELDESTPAGTRIYHSVWLFTASIRL